MRSLIGQDREPGSALPLREQQRYDAGGPALNLLATLGFRGTPDPVERIPDASRAVDWLRGNALPPMRVDPAGLAALWELREAGYRVLRARLAEARPRSADVTVLDRFATHPVPARGIRLTRTGIAARPTETSLEDVLAGLAGELIAVALDPAQLRVCAAERCEMLYLDTSRGHRRRWCSMARCGNLAKASRHRAAQVRPR